MFVCSVCSYHCNHRHAVKLIPFPLHAVSQFAWIFCCLLSGTYIHLSKGRILLLWKVLTHLIYFRLQKFTNTHCHQLRSVWSFGVTFSISKETGLLSVKKEIYLWTRTYVLSKKFNILKRIIRLISNFCIHLVYLVLGDTKAESILPSFSFKRSQTIWPVLLLCL